MIETLQKQLNNLEALGQIDTVQDDGQDGDDNN